MAICLRGHDPAPSELARIISRRGPRWWDRAIRRGTAILVLEVGGAICGYATFGPNRARNLVQKGEVYEMYVKPEYQGVGLGTRLFLTARRELVRFGFDSVVVWALADNDNACRFYRNAGGRKVARAKRAIRRGFADQDRVRLGTRGLK